MSESRGGMNRGSKRQVFEMVQFDELLLVLVFACFSLLALVI